MDSACGRVADRPPTGPHNLTGDPAMAREDNEDGIKSKVVRGEDPDDEFEMYGSPPNMSGHASAWPVATHDEDD